MGRATNYCLINAIMVFSKNNIDAKIPGIVRSFIIALFIIGAFSWTGASLNQSVYAQGTAYVQIDGVSPVLESPLLTDLERNYRQGAFRVQFVFISPSRQPESFQFKLTLEHNGDQLLEMDSEAINFEPGVYSYATFDEDPAIIFPLSYEEWLNQLNPVLSTNGILPEGDYLLRIEAIPTDPNSLIPTIPGIALFTVRYAEPPLLLTPPDGASISAQLPIFSWTPVTGSPLGSTMEYELLITEVLAGQTPAQALESNIEQAHRALIEQTSFVYSPTELPLEPGKIYAWQVQARDINDQLPILDQGNTEIYTFSIAGEGLGTGLTAWSFPITSPFLKHDFENLQDIDPNDSELFFNNALPIDLLGIQTSAVFDNVLIDVETQNIIEGSIQLENAFALEITINPLNDSFTEYKAVTSGSELSLQDGLLLDLGSDIFIDADGLHPKGTHDAQISYSGYGNEQWTATYSEDLTLTFAPFNITRGRIDFASEGVAKGYADPSGFHLLTQSDPVIAQLPDRLLIDGGQIGYIPLKKGANALVTLIEKGDAFEIAANGSNRLELILPALSKNYQSQQARFSATLENVLIDTVTGELIQGRITAILEDSTRQYTLDAIGVPLAPQIVRIVQDKESVQAEIEGPPTLFGQPIHNISPVTFYWGSDQVIRGEISLESTDAFAWLNPKNQDVRLSIYSLEGAVEAPLTSSLTQIGLSFSGNLDILADSSLAAQIELHATYSGDGYVSLHKMTTKSLDEPRAFQFNDHAFYIEEITSLDLYYSAQKGLEYNFDLRAHLEPPLKESPSLQIPVSDAELTESGLFIPEQEVHEGTPRFKPYLFTQGANQFKLLAARLPAVQLQTTAKSKADHLPLSPRYDFELHVLETEGYPPSLSNIPLTVQNASITNGIVAGPVLPFSFPTPLEWSFNTGTYQISTLSGLLVAQESIPSQEFYYYGDMHLNEFQGVENCELPTLRLVQKGTHLEGTSSPFTPCGLIPFEGFDLAFGESILRASTLNNNTSFILEGELVGLSSQSEETHILQSPGEIAVDLSTSSILVANAEIESLKFNFPQNAPSYEIELKDVTLSETGFVIPNGNSLTVQSISKNQTFSTRINDLFTLGWRPERSNEGRGELVYKEAEDENGAGYFDHEGFHPASEYVELPKRILLPGLTDAFLVLPANASLESSKKSQQGIELKSDPESPILLSVPLQNTDTDLLLLPLTSNIVVNDAFAYKGGIIEENYTDAPIDLEDLGYPVRITGLRFDPDRRVGQRLQLFGELKNPISTTSELLDSDFYIPFQGTYSSEGLAATISLDREIELYPDVLGLNIQRILLDKNSRNQSILRFEGDLTSPLFHSQQNPTYIGIQGEYQTTSSSWTYQLKDYQPEVLAIGLHQFQTNSQAGYSLETDTGFELSLSGRFKYPGVLAPEFSLGALIDIGRNGITVWTNDDLDTPQLLFGGILTSEIEAFNFEYDQNNKAVITTIDGAFIPQLSPSSTNENRIPFSGIQLSSIGTISLDGDFQTQANSSTKGQETLELLNNVSSIKLLDDAFVVNSMQLVNENNQLSLNVGGQLFLPNYDSYSPGVNLAKLNRPLPVLVNFGYDGSILKQQTSWYKSELDNILLAESNQRAPFRYQAVNLDFNSRSIDQIKLFASAQLLLSDFVSDSAREEKGILLGSPSNPASHPGIIIQEQQRNSYLLSNSPTQTQSLFKLRGHLADIYATHVSLQDANQPVFTLEGRSVLTLEGFSGYFPITGMTVNPKGVRDLGDLAAPSVVAFQNLASFELNCIENYQNSVSSLRMSEGDSLSPSTRSGITPVDGPYEAQIRFGKICGSSLPLTLTDRWFAGTYDDFNISSDDFSSNALRINGVDLQLSRLASFSGAFTYDDTSKQPFFQIDGETLYRTLELTSTGSIKQREGLPSLSLLFSPARKPLELIPDYGIARIPGGGLFYRPTGSELDLVSLALNERSNNTFTSNHPDSQQDSELHISDQLSLVAPIEFALDTGNSSLDFTGIGLLQDTEQFLYLDVDGALHDDPEKLQTDLFLVQRSSPFSEQTNSTLVFEGLSNISLNYTSVVGGVIPGNFNLTYSPGTPPTWSSNGYSRFILTDTIELPGSFLINPAGFAVTLQDTVRLDQGHFSVDDQLKVSLWHERDQPEIQGYASFISSVDLLPGYMLNQDNMYGALIKDRDEYQIYAARNQYADVPFVFNGPIDPWLAFQDGETFGGDARNSVFKRMLQDARMSSQRISGLAEKATSALQHALDLQNSISLSPLPPKELSVFSKSSTETSKLGQRIAQLSNQFIDGERSSSLLQSIQEHLFGDTDHHGFSYTASEVHASDKALDALNNMRSSITQARQSAELDIYSFQTISPRPLLWLADNVDLGSELETSPLQIDDTTDQEILTTAPFIVDPATARLQAQSLVAFKQNNESVDSQFLRAISGLENNLINLKTVRTPEQAFDFEIANTSIRQFYTQQIADDWELLNWSKQKKRWLTSQEAIIDEGIRAHLTELSNLEDSSDKLKQIAQQQFDLSQEIGQHTDWKRADIPEGTSYNQYINNLSDLDIEAEYVRTAKSMWYDAPLASLTLLSDSLSKQLDERIELYSAYSDTLNKVSDRFSQTLDPLYDVQTQYTTTLFGMADEYRIWRSSIRGLDPDAVDYSFQFTPYRGNYRILAEDLTPPVINDIVVSPTTEGFLNQTLIKWDAEHPVELAEISLSIAEDTSSATYFTSLATSTSTSYNTTKTDFNKSEKDISLTLRVRGAGGVPVIKKGQYSVQIGTENNNSPEEITLIPFDQSAPPSPVISGLSYSSYFSDTPNTLQFRIGAVRDPDSGIERVEYKVESKDGKNLIQDWTSIPQSTTYFGGRVVETSLPVQEDDITVRVTVRITNGRGLTSTSSDELELDLDVSPPTSSIKNIVYLNAFENINPNSLGVELIDIADEESGIDHVEYTISKEAQANLANAIWSEFVALPNRPTRTGSKTVYIPLEENLLGNSSNNLSIYLRATNGAGLQTVVQETIQVPGRDASAPTEPSVTLEHTGFYNTPSPNHLRIIAGNSRDFESGIKTVRYRILDGQTGQIISDWDDFLLIDQVYPTFIIPTTEKVVALPDFASSRSIIVEVQSINRAGLESAKAVRFLPIELDLTPPTAPLVSATYFSSKSPHHRSSIVLDVGLIQDEETPINSVEYRIISTESNQNIQDWTPLNVENDYTHIFPGTVRVIESPTLSPNANHIIQIRSTNLHGLSNLTDVNLTVEKDETPPLSPYLQLNYTDNPNRASGSLQIDIGESYDPQTFISKVRYRITDQQQNDPTVVAWQDISLNHASNQFEGRTLRHDVPSLQTGSRYMIDVEVINGAGLASRASAIIDRSLISNTITNKDTNASLETFYFNASNTIRSNELEITVIPNTNYLIKIDSLQYFIEVDNQNKVNKRDINGESSAGWNSVIAPERNASGEYQFYAPLPDLQEAFNAHVQVRLFSNGVAAIEIDRTVTASNMQDYTPPKAPEVDAIYYGPHHTERANELYLVLHNVEDPQSRISRVAYRVLNKQSGSTLTPDWVSIPVGNSSGAFSSRAVSIDLPDFKESTLLSVEVQTINGNNIESINEIPVSVLVDTTPPLFENLDVFVEREPSLQDNDALHIHLFGLSDPESIIKSVEYRISINKNTEEPYIDWTRLEAPQTNTLRFPEIKLNLPEYAENYSVLVEMRAENIAGLSALFSKEVNIDIDTSPPQIQEINSSYKLTTSGNGYLLIEPGSFRDPESQIEHVEYRIVDIDSDSTVYMTWNTVPLQKDIRVQLAPITISRQLLPFDATRKISIEFRAVNGVGLSASRKSTIEIPGDISAPEAPSLTVDHRNGYDPRHPNTIKIQIGPSGEDQSSIQSAYYRIINLASKEEILPWTNLPISNDGTFSGKVIYSELPFIAQETDMQVEVEITNSADLVRTVSKNVTIQVEGDGSPPSLAIQSHYLSNSIAIVLDELSDSHSRIQRVEYRLVDNVDQSVLFDWTDLFEIVNPQVKYSRQSYSISPPEIRAGRAIKVEVRATNGAGLQTTVSKTILNQQTESN